MSHIDTKNLDFDTKVIHAGGHHDSYGSATVPIYQTSTFAFDSAQQGAERFAGATGGFIYTRLGNPTITALERQVAELEGGFAGIATSSGMGAVSTVYMALLDQGTHIVGTASVYGPSRLLAEKHLSRFGVDSTWVDTTDLDNIRRAMRPTTRIVYTESVANPTMDVTDIRGRGGDCPRARRAARGGQHLLQPVSSPPVRVRCRRRPAQRHQVPEWPRRRRRGRRGGARRSALSQAPPADDHSRVQYGPAPGLPGAARPEDAVAAHRAGAGGTR